MLPKKNRADKKAIEKIFKEGKFISTPNLTFKFVINRAGSRKISVIVPKNVAKKATERNRLRRHGYNILKKQLELFPASTSGAFIFKKPQDDILILENEIKTILAKIN